MASGITIEGLEQLRTELQALAPDVAKNVVLDMSQVAYDELLDGAGRHSKTGNLAASTYNRSLGPATREVGHDPARASYAPFVVFGARAHVIAPKDKKVLRWAIGGRFIFAGSVNHPGYRGDDYLQKAADEAVRQMPAIIDKAIKE